MKANPNKSQTLTIPSQPDADKPNFWRFTNPLTKKPPNLRAHRRRKTVTGQPKHRAAACPPRWGTPALCCLLDEKMPLFSSLAARSAIFPRPSGLSEGWFFRTLCWHAFDL